MGCRRQRVIVMPVGWIHPIHALKRMKRNSATLMPTRTPSAFAMLALPLFRRSIRMPALKRAPKMPMKASVTMIFMMTHYSTRLSRTPLGKDHPHPKGLIPGIRSGHTFSLPRKRV